MANLLRSEIDRTDVKVKIFVFEQSYLEETEKEINEFLDDKIFVDLKFVSEGLMNKVVVMYKDFPF